jgi:hypothetical protein
VGEVADLFASLGLRIDQGAWAKGDQRIGQTRDALGRFQAGAGRAAGAVGGVGAAAGAAGKQAAHSFDAAGAALKGYLVLLGGRFAYDHFIKSNADMQSSIIGLSAMIEGNLGGSFQQATAQAKDLYAEFQKFSTKTPVTTAEILEFGRSVAVATFQAGGKIKDLQEITEQGVIASKVLTPERGPGYASLELSEMLMGNVSNRMVFAKQLLGFVKMTEEQFRELNAKQRMEVVKSALNSKAMKDAANAFQTSFAGVTSTFEDKLQIAFRKVGAPLFEAITKQVARFNEWLDKNQDKIEEVGKAIGTWLGEAFEFMSAAIGIVIDKGGELLDWLDQFVDSGEVVKSLMIALGAVMVAFAIESAIAFATNPVTLIVLAVAALVYGIRKLMAYPGGVGKAFRDAFDAIRRAAAAAWQAIKDGFSAAFDFIADLPVIRQLITLVKALTGLGGSFSTDHEVMLQDAAEMSPTEFHKKYPQLPAPSGAALSAPAGPQASNAGRSVSIGSVQVGDINVHAPNADPAAVAMETRKVFHEELGSVLRQTMDVV